MIWLEQAVSLREGHMDCGVYHAITRSKLDSDNRCPWKRHSCGDYRVQEDAPTGSVQETAERKIDANARFMINFDHFARSYLRNVASTKSATAFTSFKSRTGTSRVRGWSLATATSMGS